MIRIKDLSYLFKNRQALNHIDLTIASGEIFGLLGPNGSGKTTLLRVLATVLDCKPGKAEIDGLDLAKHIQEIRKKIGVVFQLPSLDLKLTVFENLYYYGLLLGISGRALSNRCDEMLERFKLTDRKKEICQHLSGGLKRRVELAKGLLGSPRLLLLDEPSTGLDPAARKDLWQLLKNLKEKDQITILAATHLMEEAEHCDRLAIMNQGNIVGLGSPESLKREIGGDVLVLYARELDDLARQIEHKFKTKPLKVNDTLQIEHERGHRFMTELVESFPGKIESVMYRRPTLEDVFVHKTGHQFLKSGE